jgi:hypothetical protein
MTPKIDMARWLPHLKAAKRRGQSVAAYAAEHGLSRHTLYTAARVLRESGRAAAGKPQRRAEATAAFAAVRVAAPAAPHPGPVRLRAHLPNGVVLHFEGDGTPGQLAAWLAALQGLPCSA